MKISELLHVLNQWAPPQLQESYDNCGLLTGSADWECTGILCALDVTDEVIAEALARNVNLIVSHHPLLFKPLKTLSGTDQVSQLLIKALRHDLALFAIHTNLDNLAEGVNSQIAKGIGLTKTSVLSPVSQVLRKLVTFVPNAQAEQVRQALFIAGAGSIGDYDECSYNVEGTGTFRPGEGTHPFSGTVGQRQNEPETRIETIFPFFRQKQVLAALFNAHPYEEVAYDIYVLSNTQTQFGAGLVGELAGDLTEEELLATLARNFNAGGIRHSPLLGRRPKKLALCGGAGSFLIPAARAAGADVFVTADLKYHDFFQAEGEILLIDLGHYESEQFTVELVHDHLREKFPTFAILKTSVNTNPVRYFKPR